MYVALAVSLVFPQEEIVSLAAERERAVSSFFTSTPLAATVREAVALTEFSPSETVTLTVMVCWESVVLFAVRVALSPFPEIAA